jgi:hypothetical protein
LRLVADLDGDDWGFQPAQGLAHPLWICGHLACAQTLLIHVRSMGRPSLVDEAFSKHFPIGGPIKSTRGYEWPTVETVLSTMERVHVQTCRDVSELDERFLAEAAFGAEGKPHPHYRDKAGAIAHANRHEAFHAGQIAMIRRLLGKSFLR